MLPLFHKPLLVIITGGPHSGKKTLVASCVNEYSGIRFSVRSASEPSDGNQPTTTTTDDSKLDITSEAVVASLKKALLSAARQHRRVVFSDDFPRNLEEWRMFWRVNSDHCERVLVLNLETDEATLQRRALANQIDQAAFEQRLEQCRSRQPLIDELKGLGIVRSVTASGSTKDVFAAAEKILLNESAFREVLNLEKARKKCPLVGVMTANSHTGMATVRALTSFFFESVRIRAIVRDLGKADRLADLPIELITGVDATDEASLLHGFSGVHSLLLVPPAPSQPLRAALVSKMIAAAKQAGVKHTVLISVMGAKEQATPIAREFREMERSLKASGMKYTILRCAPIAEDFLPLRDEITAGNLPGCYSESRVAFVSLQDIGKCAATVLSRGGHHKKKYTLTGPEALTVSECAAVFTQLLGFPVTHCEEAVDDYVKRTLRPDEGSDQLRRVLRDQHLWLRDGHGSSVSKDALSLIGAQTSFYDWARANVAHFDRRPLVAVLTANSSCGLSTIQALAASYSSEVRVRACVRFAEKARALQSYHNVDVMTGVDARLPTTLIEALTGVKRLLLVPPTHEENRVELVTASIRAARSCGVEHVVLISVIDAQHEDCAWSRDCRRMERELESSGMKWTLLRCSVFLDILFLHFRDSIMGGSLISTSGNGKFAAVALEDVGRAAAEALVKPEHEGQIFELTSPKAYSLPEYCAMLSKHVGYTVQANQVSADEYERALVASGWSESHARRYTEVMAMFRAGKGDYISTDIKTLTGRHTYFEPWLQGHLKRFDRRPIVCLMNGGGQVSIATASALNEFHGDKLQIRCAMTRDEIDACTRLSHISNIDLVCDVNYSDRTSLAVALKGTQRLLIAGRNLPGPDTLRVHIAQSMIDAARIAGVKQIVFVSMLDAKEKKTPLQKQFRKIEKHLEKSGVAWTILRCAIFAESFLESRESVSRGELTGGFGSGRYAIVTVSDVAKAVAAIFTAPIDQHASKAYDLTAALAFDSVDYARTFSQVVGHSVTYRNESPSKLAKSLIKLDVHKSEADAYAAQLEYIAKGKGATVSNDLVTLIGHQTSFNDWLIRNALVFQSHSDTLQRQQSLLRTTGSDYSPVISAPISRSSSFAAVGPVKTFMTDTDSDHGSCAEVGGGGVLEPHPSHHSNLSLLGGGTQSLPSTPAGVPVDAAFPLRQTESDFKLHSDGSLALPPPVPAATPDKAVIVLKPDIVKEGGKVELILERIRAAGLRVVESRQMQLSAEQAQLLTVDIVDQSLRELVVKFLISNLVQVAVVDKPGCNAVELLGALAGPSDPVEARRIAPNSLRALFGADTVHNVLHVSSSPSRAQAELRTFFPHELARRNSLSKQ